MNTAVPLLVAAALLAAGCGPDPGTPEYVLAKLREGRVVGGENLDLLGSDQVPQMTELLKDGETPRVVRLQLYERLLGMEPEDAFDRFSPLLDDEDPEIRMRTAAWLAEREDQRTIRMLVERLREEREAIVRSHLIRALQRIGCGIEDPDPQLVDEMIEGLESDSAERRRTWAEVLGGWHGEKVERALTDALGADDPTVSTAAARALRGPAARDPLRSAPLYLSMLSSDNENVRTAGVDALEAATYGDHLRSKGKECDPRAVGELLEVVPELPEAAELFAKRSDLSKRALHFAKSLDECLSQLGGGADAGPAPEAAAASGG
ncbi:MAG: HEAT repeat domain-containing protein [Polyangia bacterium]